MKIWVKSSDDCPTARKASLQNMKKINLLNHEQLKISPQQNKAQQNHVDILWDIMCEDYHGMYPGPIY